MFSIRNSPQPRGFCRPASFSVEIGRLGLADRAAEALVGDPDDEHAAGDRDLDLDRQLLAALVAVLDRVHRRLGDGGLELLEPARLEPERRHGGGDALHRLALVARPARDRGRPRSSAGAPRRVGGAAAERDERDVVLLLPAGAGEALEAREQAVDQLVAARDELARAAASRTSRACASAPR